MKKVLSYIAASILGLLAIAPPIDYTIPLMVNSYHWLYMVLVSGLLAMFLLTQKINFWLKVLLVYLFFSCFYSQAPYLSFNAFALISVTALIYLVMMQGDFEIILNVIQAVFWLEVAIATVQLLGKDTLMCFDRPEKVFFGTVFQYMRFSSLLCILSPLLLVRSRWYAIPIMILAFVSQSSSFALAIAAGCLVYFLLVPIQYKRWVIILTLLAVAGFIAHDIASFRIAFTCGRIPVWADVAKTWVLDTRLAKPAHLKGPFIFSWFMFGHGIDTFMPLFPIFKHDPNPFPQAHNCWLQLAWETGVVGLSLVLLYVGSLIQRLYYHGQMLLIAGCAIIATNMCFAFPTRMTQTMLLIVCFLAYCESKAGTWSDEAF